MDHEKKQRAQIFEGFIIFFFLIFRSEAVLQIIDNPSHVEAALGQDVTLPCILTDSDQPILDLDLLTASVRWDMTLNGTEHTVYLLTNHIYTVHRNNSKIEENEFRRGIASLSMRDVLESDEGEYTCSVYVTPNKWTAKINVQVSARPAIALTFYELTVEPDHERSVVCEVGRFYPKSITIRWFKSSKGSNDRRALDKDTCNSVPAENSDGTFNATSLIVVKPSSTKEDGDIYSCIVSHRSFNNNDEELNFTLKVKAPQISSITGAEYLVHMKRSNLNLFILDFKPKTVTINVYLKRVNDSEKRQICSWKSSRENPHQQNRAENDETQPFNIEEADNMEAKLESQSPKRSLVFYSCPCILQITPNIETDDGAELTIEVQHAALISPISRQCTLTVNGDCLKLSHVITPKHPTHGEEVTLTCNITKYSPGPLHITWRKKDMMKQKPTQDIYKKGETLDGRYSHTPREQQEGRVFSYSSSLTFTANVSEDHGKIYVCRVYYPALSQNMQLTFDSYVRAVPVLEPIISTPAIPSAGQQMELSCKILRFHPRELTIEWYKEDELEPRTGYTTRVDEHGLYNVVSTLELTFKLEDLGKKFKCKVGHESLEDPRILEWTLTSLKKQLDPEHDEGLGATMKKEE
ncbi:uncharacterized protein LOC120917008 isoform X2 [Rana temporaria]|uniref:uncharacterized protein LOC120917008 isoform X2 n=1 Tax=Rana temporaria TaxID=8407 RepID=UPI001AADC617|nr:uncharacterized protein LOC120917008 isoform X2 [Rana temporaria]